MSQFHSFGFSTSTVSVLMWHFPHQPSQMSSFFLNRGHLSTIAVGFLIHVAPIFRSVLSSPVFLSRIRTEIIHVPQILTCTNALAQFKTDNTPVIPWLTLPFPPINLILRCDWEGGKRGGRVTLLTRETAITTVGEDVLHLVLMVPYMMKKKHRLWFFFSRTSLHELGLTYLFFILQCPMVGNTTMLFFLFSKFPVLVAAFPFIPCPSTFLTSGFLSSGFLSAFRKSH